MICIRSLAVKRRGLERHRRSRAVFPKQKGRKAEVNSEMNELCEISVHIHKMYRHHDHLHSWVSGCCFFFVKKSWIVKMFVVFFLNQCQHQ